MLEVRHAAQPGLDLPGQDRPLGRRSRRGTRGSRGSHADAGGSAGGTAPSGTGCARRHRHRAARRSADGPPAGSRRSRRAGPRRPRPRRRRRIRCRRRRSRSPAPRRRGRSRPSPRRCARGGAAPAAPSYRARRSVGPATLRYAGMPVGHHSSGRTPVIAPQMPGRGLEGLQRGQVVHVADVAGQPGVAAVGHAEGVLQVAADGQRRPHRHRQRDRQRGVAAGAADRAAPARRPTRTTESSQGTWIGRSLHQPGVGQRRPAGRRAVASSVTIGSPDRLPLVMHQRPRPGRVAGQAEEQVVDRRVGQHQPEVGHVRGRPSGDSRPAAIGTPAAAARTGRRASVSSARSAARQVGDRGCAVVDVGHHDRERLVAAVLALAQGRDRGVVGGVAGQVIAAQSLDRDDRARRPAAGGPARSAPSPTRSARRGRRSVSVGPQAGQATVWAWNRRSAGSAYSPRSRRTAAGRPSSSPAGRRAGRR